MSLRLSFFSPNSWCDNDAYSAAANAWFSSKNIGLYSMSSLHLNNLVPSVEKLCQFLWTKEQNFLAVA